METKGIGNFNINSSMENCNPIDLSVIIKTNLLKTSNWGNHRLLEGSSIEDHNKECIRKAILNSSIMDNSLQDDGINNCLYIKRTETKEEDDMESSMAGHIHDENCNIKVE